MTENKSADFESRNLKLIYFDDYKLHKSIANRTIYERENCIIITSDINSFLFRDQS